MAEPLGKSNRFAFTGTITISMETGGRRLTVHTDVITRSSSPFLKAALSNGWKEAQEKDIVLHEFEPSALEGYVHWMYTGDLLLQTDMAFCQKLVNLVIQTRCSGSPFPPFHSEVCFVWERTLPSCPLRRVIREVWLAMPAEWSIKLLGNDSNLPYPVDFVLDVFHELLKRSINTKSSSYSGKTLDEVKAICKTFFEDAAPAEKK